MTSTAGVLRTRLTWAALVAALTVLGFPVLTSPRLSAQARPELSTDRPEYFLGSTVAITGRGFAPREFVSVTVHRASRFLEAGNPAHEPMLVAADDAGRIAASWVLVDGVGVNFRVNATGAASGSAAPVEFNRVAALKTDKRYYGANEVGQVAGAGFGPGEAIALFVEEGGVLSGPPIADESGRFHATFLTSPNASAATHRVVARGGLLNAMTGFADFGAIVADDGGPNDAPGDADLLYYRAGFRTDVSPRVLDVTIGWDATWFAGNNSSVILLDADGDGGVDRAVVTEIQGEPLEPRKIAAVYSCSDASAAGCATSQYVGDFFWQSWNAVGGGMAVQNIPMTMSGLGLPADGERPTVVSVCSNLDCVVTPGSGFLTIEQIIPAGHGTGTFTFALASGAARNGVSSWTVTPSPIAEGFVGTVSYISMAPGTYVLNDRVPAGWRLTEADCQSSALGVARQPLPVAGPATVNVDEVVIAPGQVTRCKFVVERVARVTSH